MHLDTTYSAVSVPHSTSQRYLVVSLKSTSQYLPKVPIKSISQKVLLKVPVRIHIIRKVNNNALDDVGLDGKRLPAE